MSRVADFVRRSRVFSRVTGIFAAHILLCQLSGFFLVGGGGGGSSGKIIGTDKFLKDYIFYQKYIHAATPALVSLGIQETIFSEHEVFRDCCHFHTFDIFAKNKKNISFNYKIYNLHKFFS